MYVATFVIDFDSTIIISESLEELAAIALRERGDYDQQLSKIEAITGAAMAGELPFDEALDARLQLFSARRKHLNELIAQLSNQITPSFWRQREWLRRNADRIYVVSGGFEECIVPVVAQLGISAEHVLANSFIFDDDRIISYDRQRYLSKAGGKVQQIRALALPRPIVVIGDGYTDYEIRACGEADAFWAFCENVRRPSVIRHADRVLDSFDQVAISLPTD